MLHFIPVSFVTIPSGSPQPWNQQHLEFFANLPFVLAKSLEYVCTIRTIKVSVSDLICPVQVQTYTAKWFRLFWFNLISLFLCLSRKARYNVTGLWDRGIASMSNCQFANGGNIQKHKQAAHPPFKTLSFPWLHCLPFSLVLKGSKVACPHFLL